MGYVGNMGEYLGNTPCELVDSLGCQLVHLSHGPKNKAMLSIKFSWLLNDRILVFMAYEIIPTELFTKLTYPTFGKGKSSSNMPYNKGEMLAFGYFLDTLNNQVGHFFPLLFESKRQEVLDSVPFDLAKKTQ